MSAFLISLFFTIGACTWIYTRLQRSTGNNTQNSLVATTISGVIIFLIAYLIFHHL